ncbi:MAG: (d)CMP kinase, partial [Burkholderiaceae bacterium]|nr:(d)CMP kinase [Burkholderiaceae bacterium]
RLGYHVLDSGALYRLVGVAAERAGLSTSTAALSDPAQAERIAQLARHMRVRFQAGAVLLDDHDVSQALRTESAGMAASRVSALPGVREALLQLQRDFRQLPGLVADGRDMGTVVFPDAALKVYLTASAACRAERRHAQLVQRGEKAIIQDLLQALEQRDEQDKTRTHAPLKPAEDAVLLDNSEDTIEQSVSKVMGWWSRKQPF